MPPRRPRFQMLALAVFAAAPARAEPLAFLFEGSILSLDDPAGLLGAAAPGAPFVLETVFDSLTPDADPSSAQGSYYNAQPQGDLTLDLGSLRWRSRDLLTVVANNLPTGNPPPMPGAYDAFRQEAVFDTLSGGRHWGLFVQLLLLDESGGAIATDGLPATPPDPSRFTTAAQLLVTGAVLGEDGSFTLLASVTSARAASVPGPGTGSAALASLALIAAAPTRRPRRLSPSRSGPS